MIIHVQMATDEQLSRLHACGVTPTFFVRHVNVWGERHVNLFLGEERAARLDPCGSCVRMGIPFGLHVDSPVQPVDAIRSIHTAVNRTTTAGAFSALIRGSRRSTPSKPTPSMPPSAAHGIMPSVQSLPDTMRILCSFPEIR